MVRAIFKTNDKISKLVFMSYIDRQFGRPPIFYNHDYQDPIGEIDNWTIRSNSDDIELDIDIHSEGHMSLENYNDLEVKEYYMIDDRGGAKILGLSIVLGDLE